MLFVGDLHMGRGDGAEDFTPEAEEAYLRFLERYKDARHHGVGDILELWQADRRDVRKAHKAVFQKWKDLSVPIERVSGNHDPGIFPAQKIIHLPRGGRVLVVHSHQFDDKNKQGTHLGRYVTQVVGFLERRVHKDVDRWLSRLWNAVKKKAWEYDRGIAELARINGCNMAVYGHTHFPNIVNVGGIVVGNCGCWTMKFQKGYPYISINKFGEMRLKWWV